MNTGILYTVAYLAFVLSWLIGQTDYDYMRSKVYIAQGIIIIITVVFQIAGIGTLTGG